MEQQKSGDCVPASEIIYLADFRKKNNALPPKLQGIFSRFTLEVIERAWLAAKQRCMENPTAENIAAEAILYMVFQEFWRVS
ncbi:MAG: hypothetical protein LRY36_01200 [Alphaproteobacteria bacterium]|nr:hypothetical protein [Alphaproteobacteria bacterium]